MQTAQRDIAVPFPPFLQSVCCYTRRYIVLLVSAVADGPVHGAASRALSGYM